MHARPAMQCIIWCVAALVPLASAARFPFPQSTDYAYGIQASTLSPHTVQTFYERWKSAYYEEDGDRARIKFDAPDYTVSEGIAYGMLIMVYMDNDQNDTRDEFDKLWNYYNEFANQRGLMNWKIYRFQNVVGGGAATDAEVDAATALLMAHKQWEDQRYLTDAKALIEKIRLYEVNDRKQLKPGDQWDDKKNPSYVSPAAFELFSHTDADADCWTQVLDNSYAMIKACRHPSTGYVPDWCSEQGAALTQSMSYDGIRTPWRMAWAYAWYGHADAHDIANAIAETIRDETGDVPGRTAGPLPLAGGLGGDNNACFIGAASCAGMINSRNQDWVNDGAEALGAVHSTADNYFGHTLKMLYYLLLSGNMPNMWSAPPSHIGPNRTPRATRSLMPPDAPGSRCTPAGRLLPDGARSSGVIVHMIEDRARLRVRP